MLPAATTAIEAWANFLLLSDRRYLPTFHILRQHEAVMNGSWEQ